MGPQYCNKIASYKPAVRSPVNFGNISCYVSYPVASYLIYVILIAWSRLCLVKVTELVKFSAFYGTWSFIAVFTRVLHWPKSWASELCLCLPFYVQTIRVVCFLHISQPKPCKHLLSHHVYHILCPSHHLVAQPGDIWQRSSSLCSFSSIQMFRSECCFCTHSCMCVLSLVREASFISIQSNKWNYSCLHFDIGTQEEKRFWTEWRQAFWLSVFTN